MSSKVGPNEPCSCGSGKKFKKCCGAVGASALAEGASYDRVDRDGARRKLAELVERTKFERAHVKANDDAADDDGGGAVGEDPERRFWGEYADVEIDLYDSSLITSMEQVRDSWIAFDWRMERGERLVDELLQRKDLRAGERAFLEGMRRSVLLPYEVVARAAGSATLRELTAGAEVAVHLGDLELGSQPESFLLARVVSPGISGRPELEGGALRVPDQFRQEVLELFAGHPDADARKELPPRLAQLWLAKFLAGLDGQAGQPEPEGSVTRRIAELGLDGAMAFARAHPQASLLELADLLDEDAALLCWALVDEGAARNEMRAYALELLVRLLWCLPRGWSRAQKGKDFDRMMTFLQGWESELQEAGCDAQAKKIIHHLLQDKDIPAGWRPEGAADPRLVAAFAAHWPAD